MHELSLANSLSDIILDRCDPSAVTGVEIEVGSLSGVARDAFEFCTNLVLGETIGKGVKVVISLKPATAACGCGERYEIADMLDPCPRCGGYERDILDGTDIVLKSIELKA